LRAYSFIPFQVAAF